MEYFTINALIFSPGVLYGSWLFKNYINKDNFQAKHKSQLDERQKPKTFQDIGGCDDAKEAI